MIKIHILFLFQPGTGKILGIIGKIPSPGNVSHDILKSDTVLSFSMTEVEKNPVLRKRIYLAYVKTQVMALCLVKEIN